MYLWMIIIHVKDWGCSIFQGIPSKRCMKNHHQKNTSRNIKPPRAAVYATNFPKKSWWPTRRAADPVEKHKKPDQLVLRTLNAAANNLTILPTWRDLESLELPGRIGRTPWMWDAREKSSFWLVGMGQSSLDRYKWCIFLIFFSRCQVNVSRFYVSVSCKGLLAKCGARHRISIPRANIIS